MKIDFKPRETFPTTQEQQTSTCLKAALIRYWTRFSMSALVGLCLALPHAQAQIARDPTYPRPKCLTTNERLEMLITLYDIVKIPNKVMGQETTVTGYVTDVYGPRLFVIRGYGPIISSRVPVLAAEPLVPLYGRSEDAPVRVGDRVQITGKVARFARDETERITGKPVEKPIAQRFQNKPTIVTDFVVVSPGQQGQAITASGRIPADAERLREWECGMEKANRIFSGKGKGSRWIEK